MNRYVVCVPIRGSYSINYPGVFAFSAPDDATAIDYFDKERLRALYFNNLGESRLVSGGHNWAGVAHLFPSGSTQRINNELPKNEKERRAWLKARYEELRDKWNQLNY